MFSAGSFWNHKAPPKEKEKYGNAVEVRQVIYFNCVDFFRPRIFFFFSNQHGTYWCHSIFIKSTPLPKRKALKERNPTINY